MPENIHTHPHTNRYMEKGNGGQIKTDRKDLVLDQLACPRPGWLATFCWCLMLHWELRGTEQRERAPQGRSMDIPRGKLNRKFQGVGWGGGSNKKPFNGGGGGGGGMDISWNQTLWQQKEVKFTWRLLQLCDLFVSVLWSVMNQHHAVVCVAVTAQGRFRNTTAIYLHCHWSMADITLEKCWRIESKLD